MSEYVDKIDVLRIMRHAVDSYDEKRVVEELPLADVVKVRHGRWELDKHGGLICSECQNRALYLEMGWYFNLHIKQMESVYCPYCGAKMDGKEREHE